MMNGYVSNIKKDANMIYSSCPNCKKKVSEEDSGWRCEKCERYYPLPENRYILMAKFSDCSDSIYVNFFDQNAVPIMGNTSANDMKQFKDTHNLD